jgi:hypothetical protein
MSSRKPFDPFYLVVSMVLLIVAILIDVYK